MADLRRELAGQHPSPLERLLVEEIAIGWAALHLADLDAAKARATPEQAEYYDRRHYRAHKRYLDSLVALARVRRLLAPAVAQVNIAQAGARQLNVAAPEPVHGIANAPGHVESAP